MESLIGGLVVWGYVLAGFVVVPVLAVILTSAFHQTLGKSVATAAAVWYLGAPILLVVLSWLIGLNDMWVAHQYLSLCKKDSIDSISKVSANIQAIKLDTGEPDGRYARSVSAAFGGEHLLFGFKDYPGPYRKADGAHVPGAFVVLKVRATDHIPYMGTFYATGIDLEILDPQTQIPLARRRTFARGIAEQAASGDCNGRQLHEANLAFVRRAVPGSSNAP